MHIVARAGADRRRLVLGLAGGLSCMVLGSILGKLVPGGARQLVTIGLSMLGMVGLGVAVIATTTARSVDLEAQGGKLRLGGSNAEVWTVRGSVGLLTSHFGMTMGTVLHLHDGPRPLRIAAMGHRLGVGQEGTPPVTAADVYVTPAELDALRSLIQPIAPPGPSDVLAIRLATNTATMKGALAMAAPFFGGIVLLIVIGSLLDRFEAFRSPAGQTVFGLGGLATFGGIVYATIAMRARGASNPILEIGPSGARLLDPTGARALSAAPPAAVRAQRSTWTYTTRSSSFACPALTLEWPGQAPISVGMLDVAGRWAGHPPGPTPEFMIAEADWQALLGRLGLR